MLELKLKWTNREYKKMKTVTHTKDTGPVHCVFYTENESIEYDAFRLNKLIIYKYRELICLITHQNWM